MREEVIFLIGVRDSLSAILFKIIVKSPNLSIRFFRFRWIFSLSRLYRSLSVILIGGSPESS